MKIKDELERQREIEEMRMTKWRTDTIYNPSDLNTHDPHNEHVWANNKPWWAWPLRLLGGVGFVLGIGYLIFVGLMI